MSKKRNRSSQYLRDTLFDELDSLRSGESDPTRALAVAKLAQQIMSTARVEMEFHRMVVSAAEKGTQMAMGTMQLGSNSTNVVSAADGVTEH